jgi:hypothetical protein
MGAHAAKPPAILLMPIVPGVCAVCRAHILLLRICGTPAPITGPIGLSACVLSIFSRNL